MKKRLGICKMNLKIFSDSEINWNNLFFFLLLPMAIYSISLGYPYFEFDDYQFIVNNSLVNHISLKSILSFWKDASTKTPLFYNFIQAVSFIWGVESASIYRLINILLHCLNSFFVFKLVYLMLSNLEHDFKVTDNNLKFWSIVAGIIFSLHPLQVESVVWVYSMRGVLATTFGLLSLIVYFKYLDTDKVKYFIFAFILYVLGMISKFSVATFPAIFILLDYFYKKSRPTLMNSILRHWLVISLGIVFFFIFTYENADNFSDSLEINFVDTLFIALRCIGHYIFKIFLPFNYLFDYGLNYFNYKNFAPNYWQNRFILSGTVLIFMYSLTSILAGKRNIFSFSFWFFFFLMFTGLGLIPHVFQYTSFVTDRYAYTGIIAFAFLISYLGLRYSDKISSLKYVSVVLILIFSSFSIKNIKEWSNPGLLLTNSYNKNNSSKIAFEGMFNYYLKNNNLKAIDQALFKYVSQKEIVKEILEEYVKFLGREGRVNSAIALIEVGRAKRKEYSDVLLFYLFEASGCYYRAKDRLNDLRKVDPQLLVEHKVSLKDFEQRLEKIKNNYDSIFSPIREMLFIHYPKLYLPFSLDNQARGITE